MKRFVLSLGLLFCSAVLFAQEPILGAVSKEVAGKEAVYSDAVTHVAYTPSFKCDGTNAKIKNVILMIGDGMGVGAVATGFFANGGSLTMMNLRTMGYVCTQSANNFTTDSAASGTAYATGRKTNNRRLGTDPDGKPMQNVPETIVPRGYAAGVVSTDDVHGATPAAFFAHQPDRKLYQEIWGQIPASYLAFISAGDQNVYAKLPDDTREAIMGKYNVIYDPSAEYKDSDRVLYLPPTVKVGDRGEYLPETTQMAIDFLSKKSKKGFFLMVEGARIDKEAHGNRLDGLVTEVLDFDKAIEVAVKFAEKDGHTLVLVSADHETGGVSLKSGNQEPGTIAAVFSSKGHTPCFVPLFAYGPHSRDFGCVQQNSDVANKIMGILK